MVDDGGDGDVRDDVRDDGELGVCCDVGDWW